MTSADGNAFRTATRGAHYEFICKKPGVSVEYCAEQFENDGSITATIIKNIKRARRANTAASCP